MKILLTISALFFSVGLFAQDTTFVKRYFVDTADFGHVYTSRLTPNFNNGVVLCGDQNEQRGIIINTDSLGNILWNKTISASTNSFTRLTDIISSYDSTFVVSGYTTYNNSSNNSIFCAKLNLQGDTLWTRTFPMVGEIDSYCEYVGVEELSDSSYVITASRPSDNFSKLIKIDQPGTVVWRKRLLGVAFQIVGVDAFNDSSFVLGGYVDETSGGVINISNAGNIHWSKRYENDKPIHDILCLNENIYALNGYSNVLKLNDTGNVLWSREVAGGFSPYGHLLESYPTLNKVSDTSFLITIGNDYQSDISIIDTSANILAYKSALMPVSFSTFNENGSVFIAGNGPVFPIKANKINGGEHSVVLRTNNQLEETHCSVNGSYNLGQSLSVSTDTVQFNINNDNATINNVYQINEEALLSDTNCIEALSINENKIKNKIRVYPNVTTGQVNFEFSKNGHYQVEIINLNGQRVGQFEIIGSYESFDLSSEPAGIYFYKVHNENTSLTGKIIKR